MIASPRSSVFPHIPGFNSIISILIGCAFSFCVLIINGDALLESPSIITMFLIIFGALFCVSFIRISSLCTAAIQTPLVVVFCMTIYAFLGLHAPLRQKILTIAMQLAQLFPLIFSAFTLSVLYACFRWYFQYKRQYTESLGQKVIKTSQNIQTLSNPKRYPPATRRSTPSTRKKPQTKTMAAYSTAEVPTPQRVARPRKTNSTRTTVAAPPGKTSSILQPKINNAPSRHNKTSYENKDSYDIKKSSPTTYTPTNNDFRQRTSPQTGLKNEIHTPIAHPKRFTPRETNSPSAYLPVNPADPSYSKRR